MAVIKELPAMKALQTLVLKAFDLKMLGPLLTSGVGRRLQRLDLHYNYRHPGINLLDIGRFCPCLVELAVCDSLVTSDEDWHFPKIFGQLQALKLLRVSYSQVDDWEPIVK